MRHAVRAALALALLPASARAADDLLIEVHFKPVPKAQIAIWVEDKDGKHIEDVLVTQATGKLGIGNRPGIWNFVGSWRAPYGPRVSVLPIWANRRGGQYPRLIFYDQNNPTSLGYHEAYSSPENFFCRPLTQDEHDVISVDTMTCPSPNGFSTDKGIFDGNNKSPYPPRNDVLMKHMRDSDDVPLYADLNDLDAVTFATPVGDTPEYVTAMLPAAAASAGPLVAWIEVNLEHDENPSHDYDREDDHYVDLSLAPYGVEFLGQPSVVYKLEFDPRNEGFVGTSTWAGYGDWDGKSGTVHPPDATISTQGGSGADRLREYTLHGETFRFGVYSYGDIPDPPDPDTGDPDTGDDSGSDSGDSGGDSGSASFGDDGGTGDDGGDGGWGHCTSASLAPIADLRLEGMSFDKVRVHYTIPEQHDPEFELYRLRVFSLTGEDPLTADNVGAALEHPVDFEAIAPPGTEGNVELTELWGNYTYQIGVQYEDRCGNASPLVALPITTEAQKFQTVEGFCFLATAAFGAAWAPQVQALRNFRDATLAVTDLGRDVVRFYYTYSPPLARVVRHQPLLRGMVRVVLQPVADLARG